MNDEAWSERIRNEVVVERELTSQHRLLRFTVPKQHAPPAMDGIRLDRYLSALLPTISRTMIQGWVERGAATVDGAAGAPRQKLKAGQKVVLTAPLPEREESAGAPPPLTILFRDRWLMALNKPPGQLAHQAGKTMTGTLVNQVQDLIESEGGDPREARLVNRIDRDTSGIVLVSLEVGAHTRVARAIEAREPRKEYRAICQGAPDPASGSWLDPIGESDGETIARVVRPDGQDCHTDYATLETAPDGAFALLRIRLHTGRQHQIRVHAAHHGHALVGDWVYGRPCAELPGQALHAALLALEHPATGKELVIEAPLPRELAELWQRLGAGGAVTPIELSPEQKSKLGMVEGGGIRRPSWLSAEEFARLRAEAGE
jgi:23S rRNA pseudouridine1911/1915/1917 synthase